MENQPEFISTRIKNPLVSKRAIKKLIERIEFLEKEVFKKPVAKKKATSKKKED